MEECVAQAEACVGDYDFEAAMKHYEAAMQLDPSNTKVMSPKTHTYPHSTNPKGG